MRGCSGWTATTEAAMATAEAKARGFACIIGRCVDFQIDSCCVRLFRWMLLARGGKRLLNVRNR